LNTHRAPDAEGTEIFGEEFERVFAERRWTGLVAKLLQQNGE
jgi:hypothetical protein